MVISYRRQAKYKPPHAVNIIKVLLKNYECSVAEISSEVDVHSSIISQRLMSLERYGLVESRWVIGSRRRHLYRLTREGIESSRNGSYKPKAKPKRRKAEKVAAVEARRPMPIDKPVVQKRVLVPRQTTVRPWQK